LVQGGVLLTVICLVITTEEFKKFLGAVAEKRNTFSKLHEMQWQQHFNGIAGEKY
jgi:hypothetical protein